MSKRTNLDINDAACLQIVHDLQHPTSRPTTKSTHTTMVNAPKQNFSPHLGGRYCKSTNRSTQRQQQVSEDKSRLESERVRALGALRGLRCKRKLAVEKRRETHFFSTEAKAKWIEDYVKRETAWGRMPVEDAEAAVQREHDDMAHAEIAGFDVQRARNDIWGDIGCYPRQAEWSCKVRGWRWWGKSRWWIDWAEAVERRWWTQQGDGHNHQNCTATLCEVSAEPDEARHIDSTGMGGCGRLHPLTRWDVRHVRIEASNRSSAANGWWRSGTSIDNISRVYGVSWHCPRNIAKAARDFLARQ